MQKFSIKSVFTKIGLLGMLALSLAVPSLTRAVTDSNPPVIVLNGASTINLNVGDIYTEQGAIATDDIDGTDPVTISGDVVDTSTAGTYHVTYDAHDAANNQATQAIRTVIVSDVFSESAVSTATLHVVTNVINTNGGTDGPSDFNIHVTGAGASPDAFPGSSSGTSVTVNANSQYTVSVNPGTIYEASLSPDCVSTLMGGDSVTCTVTLNDTPHTSTGSTPPNLVANPGFEIPLPANPNTPDKWNVGGFGTNDRTFLFPITDTSASEISSGNAVKVVLTSYTDGDAKWYFDPVPVVAGRQYAFSDSYISNVPTELTVEFFDALHNHLSYAGFVTIPATPTDVWRTASLNVTAPAGAAYVTVFHIIQSVGTLTLDNYNVSELPLPSPFAQGFVTLSFDDNLLSQYQNAKNILDSHNLKATFYIISHAVSGLSIENAALENPKAGSPNIPDHFLTTGSASSTFSYPIAGHTGNGAEVISTRNNSNAGWYFEPISILPDNVYSYSEWYKSSTNTSLVAQYTTASGTPMMADVVDSAGITLGTSITLASSGNLWTQLSTRYFYIPENAKSVTIIHRLTGIGNLTIDDLNFGEIDGMNKTQVLDLKSDGQEIGGHTQTHPDLSTLSLTNATEEINGGRLDLLNAGISNVLSLAYPYGSYNHDIETVAGNSGFTSARTVVPGFNGTNNDKFGLLSESVNADTTLAQVKAWIDQARADKTWLILTFHDIATDLSTHPYGTTPTILQGIADYLTTNVVPVHTMTEGLALMSSSTSTPTDTLPPVITLNGSSTVALHIGDTYAELGATTTDNVDINVPVTIGGDVVNTTASSTFHVTYNAVDKAGNHAIQVIRTVIVASSTATTTPDTLPPVITLVGSSTIALHVGDTYTEAGANATDNVDGTDPVTIAGDVVNTATSSTYHVTYNAVDKAGNHAIQVVRTVTVTTVIIPDTTDPVITLNGSSTISLSVGGTYTEAGATATDNHDGTDPVTIGGDTVNTSVAGTYHVTYNAQDVAGNHAAQVTRTVIVNTVVVPDTTAPVITLNGSSTINLNVGDTYTELGATANDNKDGTDPVTIGGDKVATSKVGTYHVTYNAVDNAGNHATQVVRTVNVARRSSGGGGGGGGHHRSSILDFNTVMVNWGQSGKNLPGDLNNDGIVDILDFNNLVVNLSA